MPAKLVAPVAPPQRIIKIEWADLRPDLSVSPMFGGFGVVFVARYKRIRVAVKVPRGAMLGEGETDVEVVQLLVREAQGMMRASDSGTNAHVVQVFGVVQGEADGWQAAQKLARRVYARLRRRCKLASDPAVCVNHTASSGSSGGASSTGDDVSRSSNAGGGDSDSEGDDDDDDDGAPLYGPAPTLFGLVMSFEEGGSLQGTLFPHRSRAPWPAKMGDKLRLAKEAASGLYSLHTLGMVHGDLKLENVRVPCARTRTCASMPTCTRITRLCIRRANLCASLSPLAIASHPPAGAPNGRR